MEAKICYLYRFAGDLGVSRMLEKHLSGDVNEVLRDYFSAKLNDELPNNASEAAYGAVLHELLSVVRLHFGMDAALIAKVENRECRITYYDRADNLKDDFESDGPLAQSYCRCISAGSITSPSKCAWISDEPITLKSSFIIPVGAHLSVPIVCSDGTAYGAFCCFSRNPGDQFNERDLAVLKLFAELSRHLLEKLEQRKEEKFYLREKIRKVIEDQSFQVFFQPIFDLEEQEAVGYEALTRFTSKALNSPSVWFSVAKEVGLQRTLELTVIEAGLEKLSMFPPSAFLSLNVSPETAQSEELFKLLRKHDCKRIVLEITEYDSVESYIGLIESLQPLRDKGIRLAVDDAGAGYSSFCHIIRLNPEFIKLDQSIIRGIDSSANRKALARSLRQYCNNTNSALIAEGVETEQELRVLKRLKIKYAQGYFLERPKPFDQLVVNERKMAGSREVNLL